MFFRIGLQLLQRPACITDEAFAGNELRVDDVGTEAPADHTERQVTHILHGSEQNTAFHFYVSYLHDTS